MPRSCLEASPLQAQNWTASLWNGDAASVLGVSGRIAKRMFHRSTVPANESSLMQKLAGMCYASGPTCTFSERLRLVRRKQRLRWAAGSALASQLPEYRSCTCSSAGQNGSTTQLELLLASAQKCRPTWVWACDSDSALPAQVAEPCRTEGTTWSRVEVWLQHQTEMLDSVGYLRDLLIISTCSPAARNKAPLSDPSA